MQTFFSSSIRIYEKCKFKHDLTYHFISRCNWIKSASLKFEIDLLQPDFCKKSRFWSQGSKFFFSVRVLSLIVQILFWQVEFYCERASFIWKGGNISLVQVDFFILTRRDLLIREGFYWLEFFSSVKILFFQAYSFHKSRFLFIKC